MYYIVVLWFFHELGIPWKLSQSLRKWNTSQKEYVQVANQLLCIYGYMGIEYMLICACIIYYMHFMFLSLLLSTLRMFVYDCNLCATISCINYCYFYYLNYISIQCQTKFEGNTFTACFCFYSSKWTALELHMGCVVGVQSAGARCVKAYTQKPCKSHFQYINWYL